MQHTHRHPRRLWSILLTFVALLAAASLAQAQVVYTYDAVPGTPAIPDNSTTCSKVTINVPESFNVGNAQVSVGVDVTHTWRGDLYINVDPPEATENDKTVLARTTGDANDNFRIMVSTNNDTTSASNDDNNDSSAQVVRYRRLVRYTDTDGGIGPFNDTDITHPVNGPIPPSVSV